MKKDLLIAKWMEGKLSKEEEKDIPDLELYQKIKLYSKDLEAPVWNKAHVQQRINRAKKTKQSYRIYLQIAAVFVAVLGLSSVFFWMGNQTLVGQQNVLVYDLPDHSKIHLENESTASFNQHFWFANRSVQLEGKAYFEVEIGKKFTVETSAGKVEVLGTKFSVENDAQKFKVMCFEGKVAVHYKNEKQVLLPQNSIEIDLVENKLSQVAFNYNQPLWVYDQVKFNAIPYAELIALLTTTFAIEIDDAAVQNKTSFTGTLQLNNLKECLDVIASTYSIHIKQINKNSYIFVEHEME